MHFTKNVVSDYFVKRIISVKGRIILSTFNKLIETTNPSFWIVLWAIQLDECGTRFHKRQKSDASDKNKIFNLCKQHQKKKIIIITNF